MNNLFGDDAETRRRIERTETVTPRPPARGNREEREETSPARGGGPEVTTVIASTLDFQMPTIKNQMKRI